MRSSSGLQRVIGREIVVRCMAMTVLAAFSAQAQLPNSSPVYRKHYAMGTVYEIVAYDESAARATEAIDKAFAEVDRLDRMMSDYLPDSDLSRMNRTAHFHPVEVPAELYEVIRESLRYSEISEGKFDISVAPLAHRWKAVARGESVPSANEVEKLRNCVGYRWIELLPASRIEFQSPCLEVELGAIGKGYAVDRAVAVLRAGGIHSALINGGGSSLYGLGAPPGEAGWLVHLRDPSGKVDPAVVLRENSVSTSQQTPPTLVAGKSFGHIIDPMTGMPSPAHFAASAVAETGTASDGLSLTFFLLGPKKGKELVAKLPKTAGAWVSPDGHFEWATTGPQINCRASQVRGH